MNYDVLATDQFEKKVKKLSKKHNSLKDDLLPIIDLLSKDPITLDVKEIYQDVY